MKSTKNKSGKPKSKSSKSSKKLDIDVTKRDEIKEKSYLTKEIETSITLLESPEESIVLEALVFLTKYADIQPNNLNFLQSRGLLPKLVLLFDRNTCILRVSLRLLATLLTIDVALEEFSQEKYKESATKLVELFMKNDDVNVKEFCIAIIARYSIIPSKLEILAGIQGFIKSILKAIKEFDNAITVSCLELFSRLIEVPEVLPALLQEEFFKVETLYSKMEISEICFNLILNLFEKLTYFSHDGLQKLFRENKLVEFLFEMIMDPEKKEHELKCLNIVKHCMANDNTNSYFVESLEFLKFANWVKTCRDEALTISAFIFQELSKIDAIKQLLFDLSVEDSILTFLRSDDKKILNTTCEAISNMSLHKYCCEKMVTPVVIKKLIAMLQRKDDAEDPLNEVALKTLHNFAKRDARTVFMITEFSEIEILVQYLKQGSETIPENSYRKILDLINIFVANPHLRKLILSPALYGAVLVQAGSEFGEVSWRSLEILANFASLADFREWFSRNEGPKTITSFLQKTRSDQIVKLIAIFVHNCMMYEELALDFVHNKLLLVLKAIEEPVKYRIPLLGRIITSIYNMCLPVKFHETNRLELTDKINEKFYLISGKWEGPFPFIEVLEFRKISTKCTIYVVDYCGKNLRKGVLDLQQSQSVDIGSANSLKSIPSSSTSINYGRLSPDPYLLKYFAQVQKLLSGVGSMVEKIKILAEFVESNLCGSSKELDKPHSFKLHVGCIKQKLGTNMIPIGYLRLGFHCERALLFKALADQVYVPATLVGGRNRLYWNEVALACPGVHGTRLKMFVVDLMGRIGQLLPLGSRECNAYCDIK